MRANPITLTLLSALMSACADNSVVDIQTENKNETVQATRFKANCPIGSDGPWDGVIVINFTNNQAIRREILFTRGHGGGSASTGTRPLCAFDTKKYALIQIFTRTDNKDFIEAKVTEAPSGTMAINPGESINTPIHFTSSKKPESIRIIYSNRNLASGASCGASRSFTEHPEYLFFELNTTITAQSTTAQQPTPASTPVAKTSHVAN